MYERILSHVWPIGHLLFGDLPLIIGVLQFELVIHDSRSLKDKRSVVRSVKDRLHREHQVSVAEVAAQDVLNVAVLALALVGTDGRYVGQTLDRITEKLRSLHDAEVRAITRQLLKGEAYESSDEDLDEESIAREMLERASEVNP
ncbi:MAG: DUF503 domain-containing protein [Phycisphaerales bacterium JB061]